MLLALSVKAGFVYGAFSVPICILMWLYLPETKRYDDPYLVMTRRHETNLTQPLRRRNRRAVRAQDPCLEVVQDCHCRRRAHATRCTGKGRWCQGRPGLGLHIKEPQTILEFSHDASGNLSVRLSERARGLWDLGYLLSLINTIDREGQ